jgi:hypothetical protein
VLPLDKGKSWNEVQEKLNTNTNRGSCRIISSSQCLGLVLAWICFKGPEYILQGWFDFTGCHSNIWLQFGIQMLIKCLQQHPLATMKMQSNESVEKLNEVCTARHSTLGDVYCTEDELKIAFQSLVHVHPTYFNSYCRRTHTHVFDCAPCKFTL